MKNKAPLALMEQLVMLLVFALAAGLCLQMFVLSDRMSGRFEAQDYAVMAVRNTAEVLKACDGDFHDGAEKMGGTVSDGRWEIGYDANWNCVPVEHAEYRVTAIREDGQSHLGKATVAAIEADGSILFEITVAWQEAAYE